MPFSACAARKSTDFSQEGVINQNLLKETKFTEALQLGSNGKFSGGDRSTFKQGHHFYIWKTPIITMRKFIVEITVRQAWQS